MSDVDVSIDVGSFNTQEISVTPEATPSLTLDLNSFHVSGVPSYTYTTLNPLSSWTINHNLGYKPIVQLCDSGSQQIVGSVIHVTINQVLVTFNKPMAGIARLI